MGLYRNHFASVSNIAFVEGYERTWTQSAPTVDQKLFITTNQTGENIIPVTGKAMIELLGDDCTNLDTPIKVSYVPETAMEGFIVNGRQHITVPGGFNKVVFSDDNPYIIDLSLDNERIVHSIDITAAGLMITGLSMVFCEKLIQIDNQNNKQLQELINSLK